jgi:hypothetical protein
MWVPPDNHRGVTTPAVACLGRGRGTTPTSGLGDDACVDRLDRAARARERADRARRRSAELADRVTELQQGLGRRRRRWSGHSKQHGARWNWRWRGSSAPPRDSSGPRTPTNGRRTSWSGGPRMSARDARTSCVERGSTARRPPRTVRKRSATEPPPRRCVPPLADPVRAPRRDRRRMRGARPSEGAAHDSFKRGGFGRSAAFAAVATRAVSWQERRVHLTALGDVLGRARRAAARAAGALLAGRR